MQKRKGYYYTVKRDETIAEIAHKNNVSSSEILKANDLQSDDLIIAGTSIYIPPQTERIVDKKTVEKKVAEKTSKIEKMSTEPSVESVEKEENKKFFGWPVTGRVIEKFSEHGEGISIESREGESVAASAGGMIIFARAHGAYGNTVIISHKDGYMTVYAHLATMTVSEGTRIEKGETIGTVGQRDDTYVLHFEIRKESRPLDPVQLLEE